MRRTTHVRAGLIAGLIFCLAPSAFAMSNVFGPSSDSQDDRPLASPIPRATVSFDGPYAPGTIVVNTAERRLYLVLPGRQALRYGVGVGRPGFSWAGVTHIANKREWPDWTPPPQMLRRRPDLPRHMEGGIDNPLGARAMYLASMGGRASSPKWSSCAEGARPPWAASADGGGAANPAFHWARGRPILSR